MELDRCGMFGALRGNHSALFQFARSSRVLSVCQCYFSCGRRWSADHLGSEHTGEASLGRRGLAGSPDGACADRYFTHYRPIQITNAPGRPEAATLVDTTTAPQSVILITGLEWSAEFPYQSHRRAIMDAFFPETPTFTVGPVERVIATAGPKNVTALIACDQGREGPRLSAFLRDLGLTHSTDLHADNCDIYEHRLGADSISQRP